MERRLQNKTALVKAPMEKKQKAATRQTEDRKPAAINKAKWHDHAIGHGGTLCFAGMRSVRIDDDLKWNMWKTYSTYWAHRCLLHSPMWGVVVAAMQREQMVSQVLSSSS